MRYFKPRLIIDFVFVFLVGSVTVAAWAGEQTIKREVVGLQLGMSFEEASKILLMSEKEEGVIALMRKFGFGDPEKQSSINKKLGKRIFVVKGSLPIDVTSIEVFFRNDVLSVVSDSFLHKAP